MNSILSKPSQRLSAAYLFFMLSLPALLLAQHDHSSHASGDSPTASLDEPADEDLYQCSMHPNIVAEEPGQCPICAMDLQPVEKTEAEGIPGRAPVRLSDQQLQLINLETTSVLREPITLRKRIPGVLVHDSGLVFTVAAWAGGRIEELYVDETEEDIEVGDPLYRLYSPELYAAMEDFLLVRRQAAPAKGLLRSARFRLEQMGLTAAQIDALAERTNPPESIDILSRVAGKVMMKHLQLGQYVREGEKLYEVVDLSELWLIAEIYQSELPSVSVGQRVAMHLPERPAQTYAGTVDRIEHHIDSATRTARLRIVFDAPADEDGHGVHEHPYGLLPDMWMTAILETDLGEQLTIPRPALFDTGRRQYVFVEQEPGLFVPRLIKTGPRADGRIIVRSGLEAGEEVVVEGTFLLDSESLLKASASGSEEVLAETETSPSEEPPPSGFPTEARTAVDALWQDYFDWSAALFDDETKAARAAVRQLRERLTGLLAESNHPAVGKSAWRSWVAEAENLLDALGREADLQAQRVAFGELSQHLQTLSENIPELRPDGLFVASCPMWHDSPSEWIQQDETVRNPFMGQAMPACGLVEHPLGEGLSGGAQ